MRDFKTLYDAGIVRRWHTNLCLKDQDLAQHQWGVAMICMELRPGNLPLIEAALTHDLGESITGDTPYLGKTKYDTLRVAANIAEREFNQEHELTHSSLLSPENQHCLRWADMFEAYLFALREVSLGNQRMQAVVDNALRALVKIGHPNERAVQLLKETHV